MLVQKLINSVIEIILFSLIPFVWWFATARKKETFFKWIGLKKITKEKQKGSMIAVLIISVGYILASFATLFLIKDLETATSEFYGMGISAILPALVYAILNTSLPEEILFRGFLLKRLSNKFGFIIGNIIQSTLFGLLHGVMFFNMAGFAKAALITVLTGAIAYSMGYINEKKSDGSILASWAVHAAANIFASIVAMFSLL